MPNKYPWEASWIWHPPIKKVGACIDPLLPDHPMDNFFMYARKVIEVTGKVKSARIRCTCRDEYKLYINGRYVGRGPSPCDPEWQYFDEYEAAKYLKHGRNVFGVICYHYGTTSHACFVKMRKTPGFLFQTIITYCNGKVIEVLSDEKWRVIQAKAWWQNVPRLNIVHDYQEVFDANLDTVGWLKEDFDDSGWKVPEVLRKPPVKPSTNLLPREIPFLRQVEIYPQKIFSVQENLGKVTHADNLLPSKNKVATIDASKPGSFPSIVFDFGKEVIGYLQVRFRKVGKGIITFSYGESLALRDVDRLVTRPGMQEWSPFRRCAFRYVKLTFHAFPRAVELKSLTLDLTGYPVKYQGAFHCSDDLLNKIWEAGRYTVELCMQDHYIDSLWRECNTWFGDMLVTMPVSYYAFGEYKLAAKCFQQMAHIQHSDGSLPAFCSPRTTLILPDYCADYVICLYTYFLHSGDKALLSELFPALSRLMTWFQTHVDEHGLIDWGERKIGDKGGWCFIDWAKIDRREEISALQFLYCHALRCAGKIAEAARKKKLSQEWLSLADKVNEIINRRLWSDKLQVYMDCRTKKGLSRSVSQSTNTLAMFFNIAPSEKWPAIQRYLRDNVNVEPIKTPFMNAFWAEVLFRSGRDIDGLELIRDYWGEMLKRGATTFWEEFDRKTEPCIVPRLGVNFDPGAGVSYCHGWSAGPVFLLQKMVLGIEPTAPGFKSFSVKPCLADLKWAKGTIPTPQGKIRMSWKRDRHKKVFNMNLLVPRGLQANVGIPIKNFDNPQVNIGKKIIWNNGQLVSSPSWLERAHKKGGYIYFALLRAGLYEFRAVEKYQNRKFES